MLLLKDSLLFWNLLLLQEPQSFNFHVVALCPLILAKSQNIVMPMSLSQMVVWMTLDFYFATNFIWVHFLCLKLLWKLSIV